MVWTPCGCCCCCCCSCCRRCCRCCFCGPLGAASHRCRPPGTRRCCFACVQAIRVQGRSLRACWSAVVACLHAETDVGPCCHRFAIRCHAVAFPARRKRQEVVHDERTTHTGICAVPTRMISSMCCADERHCHSNTSASNMCRPGVDKAIAVFLNRVQVTCINDMPQATRLSRACIISSRVFGAVKTAPHE
jgi:hypothetical protein